MKRTLNTSFLVLLVVGLLSMAPTKNSNEFAYAAIAFESEIIDYGTVFQNENGEKIFKFKNTGDAPLIISKVKTSCGCTVPKYSKEAIAPGESGELTIQYDTKKLGNFTKTITVMSNAKNGNKILKIKGNVVARK
ncbi:DUF1573 domain-containing protein [uncultured Winogradskyella sp.]|uniref:DUF1573 domain-containing protein n=1 Tax=uncultured Winogradskyella sp. TaxID=395353 RepID=UPI0026236078|nr:DUF1573 domain-containing protein [uncultured Winogradskyella sp.]